jgi:hypothetical protein
MLLFGPHVNDLIAVTLAVLAVGLIVVVFRRARRGRGRVGPGAIGAVYDMLNTDKRQTVEVIVRERTGERDPERAAGDLPPSASRRR